MQVAQPERTVCLLRDLHQMFDDAVQFFRFTGGRQQRMLHRHGAELVVELADGIRREDQRQTIGIFGDIVVTVGRGGEGDGDIARRNGNLPSGNGHIQVSFCYADDLRYIVHMRRKWPRTDASNENVLCSLLVKHWIHCSINPLTAQKTNVFPTKFQFEN